MDIYDKYIEEKILPELTFSTSRLLSSAHEELNLLKWTDLESNIDRDFSNLAKKYCLKAFENFKIKYKIKLSISVPDLILDFFIEGKSYSKKIELKSTKSTSGRLRGSMIKSLDPNVWTIICKRNGDKFSIRCGRYYLGMEFSTHEKFQDRSPRPSLNFNRFQKFDEKPITTLTNKSNAFWKSYALSALTRVLDPKQHSWQDDLVKEIIKIVLNNPGKFDKFKK